MGHWTNQLQRYAADVKEDPTDANSAYNLAMAQVMCVEMGEAAG